MKVPQAKTQIKRQFINKSNVFLQNEPYKTREGVSCRSYSYLNPLTPNDPYRGRTTPLTSKVAFYIFIQQI
jgi:hypothetical protein